MKLILKGSLLLLTFAMIFTACSPAERKEIGEQRDIIQSLAGTWKLTKATQVDEDAAKKGFPYKELDITALFPYTNFVLKLDVNNGTPSTFTTTPGSSPKLIKLSAGSWTVDNVDAPKVITLTSGSATEKVTLGGYPTGPYSTLKLKVERKDVATGKLLISYSYEFAKQ